jgi:hypothetical protein
MARRLVLTLAAVALIAVPAMAAEPAATAAPVAAAKTDQDKAGPDPKEKLICKRQVATGSSLPKRVCRTLAQIEQDKVDAKKMRDQGQLIGNNGLVPR